MNKSIFKTPRRGLMGSKPLGAEYMPEIMNVPGAWRLRLVNPPTNGNNDFLDFNYIESCLMRQFLRDNKLIWWSITMSGFYRIKDLLSIIPVSKSTIWQWIKDGKFPRPTKMSSRVYRLVEKANPWIHGSAKCWIISVNTKTGYKQVSCKDEKIFHNDNNMKLL